MACAPLLLVGAPEALRRGDRWPTAPHGLAGKRSRRPAAAGLRRPRRTDMQPGDQGQGNELESLPSGCAEVKPTNSKPPSFAPAAYTGTYATICFGSWTVAQRGCGPCKGWRGQPTTAVQLTPWNGDTFQLLWPGVKSPHGGCAVPNDANGAVSGFLYEG